MYGLYAQAPNLRLKCEKGGKVSGVWKCVATRLISSRTVCEVISLLARLAGCRHPRVTTTAGTKQSRRSNF